LDGALQDLDVIGEAGGDLPDVFIKSENGQAIFRAQNLSDEVCRGLLFEGNFLVSAKAGVNHQGDVQRLSGF